MSEEKSKKSEDKKMQSEPSEIFQNINDNLTQIRTELEKFNRDKFRENVRLAVIIVLFAVPISFSLSVTSSFYGYLYFPEVNSGGIYGNIHGIIITGLAIADQDILNFISNLNSKSLIAQASLTNMKEETQDQNSNSKNMKRFTINCILKEN